MRPTCGNCRKPRQRGPIKYEPPEPCTWDEARDPSARTLRKRENKQRKSLGSGGGGGGGPMAGPSGMVHPWGMHHGAVDSPDMMRELRNRMLLLTVPARNDTYVPGLHVEVDVMGNQYMPTFGLDATGMGTQVLTPTGVDPSWGAAKPPVAGPPPPMSNGFGQQVALNTFGTVPEFPPAGSGGAYDMIWSE